MDHRFVARLISYAHLIRLDKPMTMQIKILIVMSEGLKGVL